MSGCFPLCSITLMFFIESEPETDFCEEFQYRIKKPQASQGELREMLMIEFTIYAFLLFGAEQRGCVNTRCVSYSSFSFSSPGWGVYSCPKNRVVQCFENWQTPFRQSTDSLHQV